MKKLSCTLLTVAASLNAPADLVDGLIGYWDFETDLSNKGAAGAALDMTVAGGSAEPGWTGGTVTTSDGTSTRPGGIAGAGLNVVDVENDRFNVPAGTALLGDSFSISAWYHLSPQSNNASTRFYVFESANNFDVSFGISSGNTYASYAGQTLADNTVTSRDAWHHVVHSFDASGGNTTLTIWIDGANEGSLSVSTSLIDFPSLNFGWPRTTAADRDWDGVLDEIALWDRALTSDEVADAFASGQAGTSLLVPEPSSIALLALGGLSLLIRRIF